MGSIPDSSAVREESGTETNEQSWLFERRLSEYELVDANSKLAAYNYIYEQPGSLNDA